MRRLTIALTGRAVVGSTVLIILLLAGTVAAQPLNANPAANSNNLSTSARARVFRFVVERPNCQSVGSGVLLRVDKSEKADLATFVTVYHVLQGMKGFGIYDFDGRLLAKSTDQTECYVARSRHLAFVRLSLESGSEVMVKDLEPGNLSEWSDDPGRPRPVGLAVGFGFLSKTEINGRVEAELLERRIEALCEVGGKDIEGLVVPSIKPNNDDLPLGATPGTTRIRLLTGETLPEMDGGLVLDRHRGFVGLILGRWKEYTLSISTEIIFSIWNESRDPTVRGRWKAFKLSPFNSPSLFFSTLGVVTRPASDGELIEIAQRCLFRFVVQTPEFHSLGSGLLLGINPPRSANEPSEGTFVTTYQLLRRTERFWIYDCHGKKVAESTDDMWCYAARNRNLAFVRLPLKLGPGAVVGVMDPRQSQMADKANGIACGFAQLVERPRYRLGRILERGHCERIAGGSRQC
jgi:hypothetical protein